MKASNKMLYIRVKSKKFWGRFLTWKGPGGARSLSAGQWAWSLICYHLLTGRQIDSWPCQVPFMLALKSEFETDWVIFSHIVSLLALKFKSDSDSVKFSLQYFRSSLKFIIWHRFGHIFLQCFPLAWKSKSDTDLVRFSGNISLLAWKSESNAALVKFYCN